MKMWSLGGYGAITGAPERRAVSLDDEGGEADGEAAVL